LNDTNWVAWYVHITKILKMCGVEGYVKGTLICPDHNVDSEGARKWSSNDAYAQVIISMNVSPSEYTNIPMCDNAHEMWENLECAHRSQGFRTLFAYRRRLCQTVAGENDNVVEHLDKLKKYRQQMNFAALCNKRFAISDSSFNMIIADSLPPSWDYFKGPYIGTRPYIGDAEPGTMISSQRFIEVIEGEYHRRERRDREFLARRSTQISTYVNNPASCCS
jgi:hypothetical protein